MMILYTALAAFVAWVIHMAGFAWFIAVAAGAAAQCLFSYMRTGREISARLALGVVIVAAIPRLIGPILFGDSFPAPITGNMLETVSWALSFGCFITSTVVGVIVASPNSEASINRASDHDRGPISRRITQG